MTLLAIETSTSRGSVALWRDGALVLDEVFTADRSHSSTLFPILERARSLAPRLDTIAVGLGPGSYAGVRIAIAAALGLALAENARLLGLASVAALESSLGVPPMSIESGTSVPAVKTAAYLAIGDARRESFYFTRVENGLCLEGPLLLDAATLREKLAQHENLPVYAPTPLPDFPRAQVALPRAALLAELAATGRGILAEDNLEPLYLRDPHITQPKAR
jgi:tRNA threonylcarbamoyladenosine biosynthesis protein TsaB